ncbi:MAG: D-aminoacylase, partial [bacterium]
MSPGFIDMNDHSYFSLLVDGRAESKIRQGVTTAICGEVNAPAPMDTVRLDEMKKFADDYDLTIDWSNLNGYYRRLQGQGISINYASYTSANQIRKLVVGMEDRKPTVEEMQEMKRL